MEDASLRHYGFSHSPFGPATRLSDVFCAQSHVELINRVVALVLAGRPVTAVRGERGAGKTSLLPILAAHFRAHQALVVPVDGDTHSPLQVQGLIAEAAGLAGSAMVTPDALFQSLSALLHGRCLVLLFDNASALPTAMFRYIGLLGELCRFGLVRLHVVLLGRFGPWAGLEHPDLRLLREACVSSDFIPPLREDEAAHYLNRKLTLAGRPLRQVMTHSALTELCERAQHLPGQIDALTESALAYGHAAGLKRLTLKATRHALDEEPQARQSRVLKLVLTRSPGWGWAAACLCLLAAGGSGGLLWWQDQSQAAPAEAVLAAALPPPTLGSAAAEPADVGAPPAAVESAALPTMAVPAPTVSARQTPPPAPLSTANAVERALSDDDIALAEASRPAALLALDGPPTVAPAPQPATVRPDATIASLLPLPDSAKQLQVYATQTPPRPLHAPGLVLVAGAGDSIHSLYDRVYRNLRAPSYAAVAAINRAPIKPGSLVIFPEPPGGWPETGTMRPIKQRS